jgi:AraC-like DNA-binding protein
MRRATCTIACGSIASWASLAADCGYVDQAHLIREFRALTGVTPRVYQAGMSEIDNTRSGW